MNHLFFKKHPPNYRRRAATVRVRRNLYFLDQLSHFKKLRAIFYKRLSVYPLMPDSKKNCAANFRFPGFWPGVTVAQSSIAAVREVAKESCSTERRNCETVNGPFNWRKMQNSAANISNLTPEQQSRVMARLDELQMQDSMNTFNGLVERCFGECIISFRSKDLDTAEKECVQKCVQKFMNFSQRVGQRFAEKHQNIVP